MSTLSLAMIVKNEGATIERVLSCAKLFCDEMIVVDTGSADDTVAKAKAMGAQVHHFQWIDDFAAARNYSFSQCAMDWIIWLDGDDVVSPENQNRILDLKKTVLDHELQAIYLRYVYPPFQQWRERIVRRDLVVNNKIMWKNPVHEFIDGIDGQKTKYFDNISILHDTPLDRSPLKKGRNISILRRQLKKGAVDDRSLYIYAVECLHSLLKDEGERILKRFFLQVRIPEYRYEIYIKLYHFHMHFGEPQLGVEALSKAIAEDPSRAEAYYNLGKHVSDKADRPDAAIPLLTLASTIKVPSYGTPEMEAYTYGPWQSLSRAHFRLGRWEAARQMATKALDHKPPETQWLADLAGRGKDEFAPELLPPPWQEWMEGNLDKQVPRWTVIRILEENGFSPGQIIETLKLSDNKATSLNRHGETG
jgi:glycosyltransferase involved in cell wall biosynthesis